VPWSRSWSISAPEFIDDADDEVVFTASPASVVHHLGAPSRVFSSFGEFASTVLGLSPPSSTVHIFWEEKTLVATVPQLPLQQPMVFRLVDLEPFIPLGAQCQVVNGRLVMHRVVIGHVPQHKNDLAIATLQPMPQGPINFIATHNIIEDFL
jgi:hypothetical protein